MQAWENRLLRAIWTNKPVHWNPNDATKHKNATIRINILTARSKKALVIGDILFLVKIILCIINGFNGLVSISRIK